MVGTKAVESGATMTVVAAVTLGLVFGIVGSLAYLWWRGELR